MPALRHTVLSLLPPALRDRLVRSMVRIDDAALTGIVVNVASSVEEMEGAARLVHDAYVARGLIDPQPAGVRITPHGLLPSTVVFVARVGSRVVGTCSLVLDSPLGLPLERAFGTEVRELRDRGERLAEVEALAVATEHRRVGVSYLLNKLMWRTASLLEVDRLLVSVHPRTAPLYQASLLFQRMGAERGYPGLKKAARAVLLNLDLRTAPERLRAAFAHLPPDGRNPHFLYVQRHELQLRVPTPLALESLRPIRLASAAHLTAMCPGVLDGLDHRTLAALAALLPGVPLFPSVLATVVGAHRGDRPGAPEGCSPRAQDPTGQPRRAAVHDE
jgi:hypothetical protein